MGYIIGTFLLSDLQLSFQSIELKSYLRTQECNASTIVGHAVVQLEAGVSERAIAH